jgi:hypothetical protein
MNQRRVRASTVRIAMWSGPRNISTAMMRSFGARPDTVVVDEPLYAHYLQQTRAPHPGIDEVIAAGQTDWRKVVASLTGPVPDAKSICFQKHMAHHLLPHIDRGWLRQLTHFLLIRDPREMLTSLIKTTPHPTLADTGLPQQIELFESLPTPNGRPPPILDARDVLEVPRTMLTLLCERLGVTFTEQMLGWPPGRRDTDGVWARYWYSNVEKSTGFEPYRPKNEPVPPEHANLLAECMECYEALHEQRLRP